MPPTSMRRELTVDTPFLHHSVGKPSPTSPGLRQRGFPLVTRVDTRTVSKLMRNTTRSHSDQNLLRYSIQQQARRPETSAPPYAYGNQCKP
ncbi:hypothetical protein [Aporhodopirellula aestuarii]|uniref:Uncharacterized protein n=1 Tax=Aporhodopirellula aestuarii TaxID=2950107 RepID=A0ABT0U002_9BACT|nr:hypothetical protein [Aporhodopirellula aestuarii]MCM2370170.1 hypothetical protein [Aporhodopirellula aestuarii]